MEKKLLSLPEAAKELDRSPVTLWRQIKAGRLKAEWVGRQWVIERDELTRFRSLKRDPGRPPRTPKSDDG